MSDHSTTTIIDDFGELKAYLGLSDELELHLNWTTSEGFYREKRNAVMIGLKNGYWRKLLVHECLHAKGLQHYDVPTYGGDVTHDEYSEKIENAIFNNSSQPKKIDEWCEGCIRSNCIQTVEECKNTPPVTVEQILGIMVKCGKVKNEVSKDE